MCAMSVERLAELMRGAAAVRRADGRRASAPSRGSRTSARRPASGRSTTRLEYATIDAFLENPVKVWDFYGKRLAHARRGSAERRPSRARRARGSRLGERGDHAEHRPAARASRLARARRGARLDPDVELSRLRNRRPVRRGGRAAARSGVSELRADPQAGRRHVRRAPAGGGDRARDAARGRAPGVLLVVGSSLEVYPVAGLAARDARRRRIARDRQPRLDPVRRAGGGDDRRRSR